ncbi:MAG: hypothetical protein JWQ68_2026 [Cryobacterium sp.]|jgi:hypothetical protein|nr:hypothetical protein [Cryobacterium sp.]
MEKSTAGLVGVVIGSVVTLAGAVFVPWARDQAGVRAAETRERRSHLRGVLRKLNASFTRRSRLTQTRSVEEAARIRDDELGLISEMALILRTEESDLVRIAYATYSAMSGEREFAAHTLAFVAVSGRWYRGEVRNEDVLTVFEAELQSAREAVQRSKPPGVNW